MRVTIKERVSELAFRDLRQELPIEVEKIKRWAYQKHPLLISKYQENNWKLDLDSTWEKIFFYTNLFFLPDSSQKVLVLFTYSWIEWLECKKFLQGEIGKNFRKSQDIDCHAVILLSEAMFFDLSDFELFFDSFDCKKGYSMIDFSHYDDKDNLFPYYAEKYPHLLNE